MTTERGFKDRWKSTSRAKSRVGSVEARVAYSGAAPQPRRPLGAEQRGRGAGLVLGVEAGGRAELGRGSPWGGCG
eukprot:1705436-Alexandrium_andersonii.AAC.1